jgi:hypothetical protein
MPFFTKRPQDAIFGTDDMSLDTTLENRQASRRVTASSQRQATFTAAFGFHWKRPWKDGAERRDTSHRDAAENAIFSIGQIREAFENEVGKRTPQQDAIFGTNKRLNVIVHDIAKPIPSIARSKDAIFSAGDTRDATGQEVGKPTPIAAAKSVTTPSAERWLMVDIPNQTKPNRT